MVIGASSEMMYFKPSKNVACVASNKVQRQITGQHYLNANVFPHSCSETQNW